MAPLCALAALGIWLLPGWLLGTSKRSSRTELSVQSVLLPRPREHLSAPEWDLFVPTNGSAHIQEGGMSWQNAHPRVLAGSDSMFIRLDPEQAKRSCDPKQGIIVARRSDDTTTRKETHSLDELVSALPELSHIELLLRELFATVLAQPLDRVSEQCDFFEAGGDSLALVSLLLAIERHFQVSLDPLAIYDHPVLSDLAVLLAKQGKIRTPGPIYEAMHS
jgi:acyl carrier protein